MSYKRPNTGNDMNDYFSRVMAFSNLAPNLLKAATAQGFEVWMDKLMQIDRRSLVLYLKKHREELPPEHWERAKACLSGKKVAL